MKLATFHDGTRDGALAVVSRDLTKAVRAEAAVAGLGTMQQLLDHWQSTRLQVERIYAELNEAADGHRPAPFAMVDFDEARCAAPLPRAYQ
jgi:fumarylacetoacetate (FAA) hydrolase